jgi:hypothetical protein
LGELGRVSRRVFGKLALAIKADARLHAMARRVERWLSWQTGRSAKPRRNAAITCPRCLLAQDLLDPGERRGENNDLPAHDLASPIESSEQLCACGWGAATVQ